MQLSGSGEMGRVERDSVIYVVNECVVWLYHPPYTLYYLDSHSSVSIGYPVLAVLVLRPRI